MIPREGLRETVELVSSQEPQLQRPTRSYDLVSNPNLRAYLERCEEGIQSCNTWSIRSSRIPRLFEDFIGSDQNVWVILDILRNRSVLEFTTKAVGERNFYSLDPDNLRVFFAFWWTLRQEIRLGKPLKLRSLVELERRVKTTQEALGSDPLRELLHDPLPNESHQPKNKSVTTRDAQKPVTKLPLFAYSGDTKGEEPEDGKPRDAEEVLIEGIEARIQERPVSGKTPSVEEEELARASFWTKDKLMVLYLAIPDDVTEEVSYPRLPSFEDGQGIPHFFQHQEAKMAMFISAAVAEDRRELARFDPLLEELNYRQLRLGLRRCIFILEKRPDLGRNLAELYQAVKKQVERNRAVQPRVYVWI